VAAAIMGSLEAPSENGWMDGWMVRGHGLIHSQDLIGSHDFAHSQDLICSLTSPQL
jgi:hypothetical protein